MDERDPVTAGDATLVDLARGSSEDTGSRRRSWRRSRSFSIAGFIAWIVVATIAILPLVFHIGAKLGPGSFNFSLSPSMHGRTEIVVAPLGTLSAKTHSAPVNLTVGLDQLNLVDAIGSTANSGTKDLEAQIREDLPSAAAKIIAALVATAAVVGAFAALAFPGQRSRRRVVLGALSAVATVGVLTVPVALTYNPERLLTNPELTGPIAASDELVAKVTSLDSRFGTVQSRVDVLSQRIADLYSSATTKEIARSEGDVVLLHVSDIHLNGVGISLAKDLAEKFKVDAVVDTGDFTSFGFSPEAGFTDQLKGFKVPYYLVPGNHDSAAVRAELKRSPYLHYIDQETFKVGDLTILGIADPTDTALRITPKSKIDETYRDQFPISESLIAETNPDLVLVHNPVQLTPLLGKIPVASAGHLHLTRLEVIDGTIVAIVGSSGATGLGNLLIDRSQPYRFELLRFSNRKLVAVDQIELNGDGGDFSLKRRMIRPQQNDTTSDIPEAKTQEPSLEQIEKDDPKVLDAVTSSSTSTLVPEPSADSRSSPSLPESTTSATDAATSTASTSPGG